jgi:hypothetical protein
LQQQGTTRTASTSTSSTSTSTSSSTKASSSSTQQQQQQQQQQQRTLPKAEEPLEQIRARVFGAHVGDGRRSGRRALMRPLRGKEWAGWYYFSRARQIPFLEDDLETECVLLFVVGASLLLCCFALVFPHPPPRDVLYKPHFVTPNTPTTHTRRRLERVELFKATERAPPKKGQGKRASKKK